MKNNQLVSVIIISYNNYHYIYQAINSVLAQDYNNIEIIINNDGSSDFKNEAIIKYLKINCNKNIKRYVVNNNPTNIGTVKNINKALKFSHGKYVLIFAADDAMYDFHVISKFITAFQSIPKNELVVTSQLAMYDTSLTKQIELFVSDENKEKIINYSPEKLFGDLSLKCLIPGSSTCYKKTIFKKYKLFDERYTLVEDYSSSLKLSRLGVKFNYFDFISFKHRDGGISHGNVLGNTKTNSKYELDIINIMKYEVKPYLNLLDKKQINLFEKLYRSRKWEYEYVHKYNSRSKRERRFFVLDNMDIFISVFFKKLIFTLNKKSTVMLFIGLIIYLLYAININTGNKFTFNINIDGGYLDKNTSNLIAFLGLLTIIASVLIKIIHNLYIFVKKIMKFLEHIV